MAQRSEADLEPFIQTACKAIRYAAATAYAAGWAHGYDDAKGVFYRQEQPLPGDELINGPHDLTR